MSLLRVDRQRHVSSSLATLAAICGAALCGAAPASAFQESPQASAPLVLDVTVNDWPLALVARFWERGDRLCVLAGEFEGLGFILQEPYVTASDGRREVCLQDVPGLTWRLDLRAQIIAINAPFDLLAPTRLSVAPPLARVEAKAGTGALLAYDAYGEYAAEEEDLYYQRFLSTSLDGRFFTPSFTAESTGYVTIASGEEPSLVRLDTWVDFDNTDHVERLRIGDSYTSGLEWLRPVRFAGVHWGTNFSLRPDLVTVPMATVRENLDLPSTVDIFVNGARRFSNNAAPGALELTDLPRLSGANQIRVVITDPNGRRRETVLPLYTATRILAPGLSDYNVFAGFAREDYGVRSNVYGEGIASANYRRGFEGGFTLSGEINGAADYFSASLGGAATLFDRFMLFGGGSMSGGDPGTGVAWLAGFERIGPNTSFAARYVRSDDAYRSLAARLGYESLVEQGLVSAGATLGAAGNLNISYAVQRSLGQPRSEVAMGSYTLDLFDRRASLFVSGYSDLTGENWGGTVSLLVPLGEHARSNFDANVSQSSEYYSVQAHGDAYDQRLNWSVVAAEGQFDGGYVDADWRGRYLDLAGRAVTINGSSAIEANIAQSFVFMPEGAFVGGRIDDGFTLVKVDDFKGVEVFLENRPVGRTDRNGNLLVTGLESYVGNALSINPLNLPIDAQITRTTALVAPRYGAGMLTRFEVSRELAVLVSLRLPDGGAVPLGALASIIGGNRIAPVGYDGEVYLQGLAEGRNQIEVTWNGGRCVAAIDAVAASGRLARGQTTCAP